MLLVPSSSAARLIDGGAVGLTGGLGLGTHLWFVLPLPPVWWFESSGPPPVFCALPRLDPALCEGGAHPPAAATLVACLLSPTAADCGIGGGLGGSCLLSENSALLT